MGTRSTVRFYDQNNGKTILSLYQQYDGYIDGVGHDLANFLLEKKMVNGFGNGETMEGGYANGMRCLAAQYVAQLKTEIGNVYLTTIDDEQDYNYEVRFINDNFYIKVTSYDETPFEGTPQELLDYEPPEEE